MPKVDERYYRAMSVMPVSESKMIESDFYVEGYATTVEDPYLLWEYSGWKFFETISRDAFAGTDMSDVIMQYDHEGRVFARQSNKSLVLLVDSHGLKIGADLSRSSGAKGLYEDINAKLITRMSWAFVPDKITQTEDETNKTMYRRIEHVKKIYDVSAVSIPANDQTSISARAAEWSSDAAAGEIGAFLKRKAEADKNKLKLLFEMEAMR